MSVTHRCPDGTESELEAGRYLPDADEYRTKCDQCGPVYHNGDIEHE